MAYKNIVLQVKLSSTTPLFTNNKTKHNKKQFKVHITRKIYNIGINNMLTYVLSW